MGRAPGPGWGERRGAVRGCPPAPRDAGAPSASALPRSPENLRACRRCDQLIGLDVSDCPYCGLRQSAVQPTPEHP